MCQRSTCSARGIFVDIRRGISEERYQTSYHVRKLKNGKDWLFLCDTWLRYLKKLQFMLTATRQISNLSHNVSKEILSDLVRDNVAELSDKFSHLHYATRDMCKGALNNCSMLKLRFLISTHTFAMYCKNVSHQYHATNQNTKPHFIIKLPQIRGRSMCIFFYLPQLLLLRSLFSFER